MPQIYVYIAFTEKFGIWQIYLLLQLHCYEGGTVESVNACVTSEEKSKVLTL